MPDVRCWRQASGLVARCKRRVHARPSSVAERATPRDGSVLRGRERGPERGQDREVLWPRGGFFARDHALEVEDSRCDATMADWIDCRRAVGDDLCMVYHPDCRWEGCPASVP